MSRLRSRGGPWRFAGVPGRPAWNWGPALFLPLLPASSRPVSERRESILADALEALYAARSISTACFRHCPESGVSVRLLAPALEAMDLP